MGAELINDLTGEAVITDKAERRYHVVFDLSAVMVVESMAGRSAMDILMGRPSATDCVAMIVGGCGGYSRRSPNAPKVTPKLAMRILEDSGGVLKLGPTLAASMSCAEALGLRGDDEDSDDADGEDDRGPLASPPS